MKKLLLLVSGFLLLLALTGCGSKTDSSSFIGLVFSVVDGRVLVVQGIESADIPYDEWFEAGNDAIIFTIDANTALRDAENKKMTRDKIEAGQRVEVLFSGAVMKSYPGQATADKIRILKAK